MRKLFAALASPSMRVSVDEPASLPASSRQKRSAGMEISAGRLAAATVSLLLLALVFTMLTLLLGAATGNRVLAIGTSAALALLAYVVDSLAVLVDALETVQPLSPFYLYRSAEPLRDGLDPVHALVLLALAAAFAAVALPAFDRRDARL